MASCLVIAKDYWGTCLAIETANRLYNTLLKRNIVNANKSKFLLGDCVSVSSIKHLLEEMIPNLTEPNKKLLVIMVGHGNQITDMNSDESDNLDEIYQLPDGNLSDDYLTSALKSVPIHESSLLILISDHCSSGTMLDRNDFDNEMKTNWVNISSSLPYEDSYTSGDGNVMSYCLMQLLNDEAIHKYTVEDISKKLSDEMKNSFIGELQHICVTVSRDEIWKTLLFEI
jgi:hypothetical protein